MAAGLSSLVISRAGSTVFEIAAWGKPAILIPLGQSVSHDQTHNAFAFARSGGALVIEENNLTPHLLISEVNRLFDHQELLTAMGEKSKEFFNPRSARIIAEELIDLALQHENL
jgi:UDP-N-acetylglucosamine--N-acetylmuramyl-(pentapeptide) pyrophosphoryl-undecaprenol N-acetylglucosamine transferase